MKYNNELIEFFSKFNERTHEISAALYYYTPNVETKKKKINKKQGDLDNLFKPINDLVFSTTKVDDSAIGEIYMKRILSNSHCAILQYDIKLRAYN